MPLTRRTIPKAAISTQDIEDFSALARALGHPHRVAIIRCLRERNACICGEIVDILPIAQSTVSQHLKKLKEAGWIKGEIEGPRTCYCLNDDVFRRFRELVELLIQPGRETPPGACPK